MPDIIAKRYRLKKIIGRGGMSTVHLALDSKTGKEVAIKIMHESLVSDPAFIRRFSQEIEISKTLKHKNIVRIYSYGQHEGKYYLVYEYIKGQTLDKLIGANTLSINKIGSCG